PVAAAADRRRRRRAAVAPGRVRRDRTRGLGGDGAAGAGAGARGAGARLCASGPRAGRVRRAARGAARPPQHPGAGDRRCDPRRRGRDHGRGGAVVRGVGRTATHAVLGRDDRGGARSVAGRAVGVALPRARHRRHRAGRESPGRWPARRARRQGMTDIAYHPTRLRALRDQFRALRASEFPWTADTVYLNNASIGPIPERTRRALDEFTAKRTAPHLLPDRELRAGLQAAREAVAGLINAEPGEIALATNTSHGLNLAARALPLNAGDVVLVSALEPAVAGWMAFEGTDDFSKLTDYNPTFRPDARRFEMVTLPFQDFYGMTESVRMLGEIGVDDIAQHTRALHEPVLKWAEQNDVRIVSPQDDGHRSAIICIAPPHPAEAYHAVKRAHIVCSLREGAIRLPPHCYNTVEEMERVLDVLDQLDA